MRKSKQKHTLAMALSAVMILNTMPIFADEVNIEVSEYIHDADCNYIEGQPCIHEHTEDCHTLNCIDETEEHNHNDECFELSCTHLHNADCEYVEAIECSCMKQAEENKEINCTLAEGCNQLSEHEGECEIDTLTDNYQQVKMITDWTFIDAENLVEGVLALPGVNVTQQIDVEALVQMLPTEISVQINEEPSTLKISDWTCPEYNKDIDDNWPISGEYTFKAELPEGYECETLPSVKVLLGGAELYAFETGQPVGDFTVKGNADQYEFDESVLTIKSGATLTIQNTDLTKSTKHRIVVGPNATNVNITLNGVNIDLNNGNPDDCAFDMTGAEVNLILTKGSVNTLISGGFRAGLEVPEGAKLTIKGSGTLIAKNNLNGAGIGGKGTDEKGFNGGNITIMENVIVNAESNLGAGIGGGRGSKGNGGNGGTITIQDNATVTATSADGAGIGGGMSNADANAKGGDGGTVIIQDNAQVTSTSTQGAGIGGGFCNHGGYGGNGGTVEISGKGTKVIADGMAAIGSSRPFPNEPNGGKLSVTDGATLELKNGNADAVSEFKNCTIIYSNGAEIQYDDQSKVITNLSLNATINDNDSGNVTVTATLTGAVDGNAGKTIRFSGNIEVSKNTNANGIASLTISNLKPGKYTFTASYAGDDDNNSATASVTINIMDKSNGTSSTISAPKNTYQSTSDTINQTISSYNLKSLIRNKKNLTLNSNQVSMTFEPTALKAILDVLPSSARRITFTAVPKEVKVNQDGLKIDPIYDFSISYKDTKGKNVVVNVDFPKGSASIALKYESIEKPESLFIVTVDEKGNVTWLDQSSYKDGRVMAEVEHYSIYGVAYKASEIAYVDIKDHWAESDIKYVLVRNLLTGTSAQTFSPDAVMTQGMLAAALERLNGIEPKAYIKDYKADASLTREEMAVIIFDYMKESGYTIPSTLKAVKYADQRLISTKARSSVKAMQQAGIIKGKAGNLYDPQGSVTKGEGAAMLRRLIEVMIEPTTANGWHKNDSGQWKFYEKGKAVTGWQTIETLTYSFNEFGEMDEGWKLHNNKWYYWNNDGAVIGWKFINGKWYYFESDGVMASNTWIEGYELGADGAMKTN